MAVLGSDTAAAQAFTRFGLGGRPEDALPPDPVAWLNAQLTGPDPFSNVGLPTLSTCLAYLNAFNSAKPGSKEAQAASAKIAAILQSEINAHLANALTTAVPFRERLVWFWANHFAILTQSIPAFATSGIFVRQAIRPYVNKTFSEMLLAVIRHPAMQYSLNNAESIGPDSTYAIEHLKRTGIQLGLNENLGRECLELHTVGVNGGYTQADVDALAAILSGWGVSTVPPRGFLFNLSQHEPTAQTLLGQTYPPTEQGGIAALQWLATQPDTYLNLATELVTHFVSDTPEQSDILSVASALQSSGGNLAAAASALVALPNAWQPLQKFRPPLDHTIAVLRAVGATPAQAGNIGNIVQALGQPTWGTQFPNGWSDLAADWVGPAQVLLRADWVSSFCSSLNGVDALTIAGSSLGPFLSPTTQALIGQLTSLHDQFVVLFCSPEFQRR